MKSVRHNHARAFRADSYRLLRDSTQRLAFVVTLLVSAWLAPLAAHAQSANPTFRSATAATLGGGVVSFRGASSAATTGGALVVARPAATEANDVMIAAIGVRPATASLTPPAGWVLVRRVDNPSGVSSSLAVYGRLAGAAEPASYSWTLGGSAYAVGGIQSFSGVDTANPIDVESGRTTGWSLNHPTPSVNTTVANTVVVTAHTFPSAASWTPPAGMTEGFDAATPAPPSSTGQAIEGSWARQSAAGVTGTKTATASNDADSGNTHILALRPTVNALSIGLPAGAAANDVMIASIGVRPSTATIAAPAGWTLVRRIDNANPVANSLAVYGKVAGAAEPVSYAWRVNGANFAVGGIQSFFNVDTTNPIDVENGQATPSGLGHSTPSVETSVPNALVVTSHTFSSSTAWTPPPGMAESFDQPSGAASSTGQSITGGHVMQAAAGPTGVKTATAAGDADVGNTHILALRPGTPGPAPTSTPFSGTPIAAPGIFEAEDFDRGGESVAYHDNTQGNQGGLYRPNEDVDIFASTDAQGGGYVVRNFDTGEWMNYTLNVAASGKYDLAIRAASGWSTSAFHIEIDGEDVTGRITVPNTGGWDTYQWVVARAGVSLVAGQQVLRIVSDEQGFRLNAFRITQDTSGPGFVGQWSGPFALPIVPIHLHLLPDGNVLAWGNPNTPPLDGGAQERLWDPNSQQPVLQEAPNPFVDVYCSGHSFLPDGRLLLAGGHLQDFHGSTATTAFDFRTRSWSAAPPMSAGRWYPTNTTLPNGDVLVVSGTIDGETNVNTLPEVWNPATGWRSLANAQLTLPLYPWMHLAPNGQVFNSGPGQTTRYLDTSGSGSWTTVAFTNFGERNQYEGASVMYEPGKVLILGGGVPATASAEIIDLNDATPRWRFTSPMARPRRFLNATLLPDGKVLVTGGSSSSEFSDPRGAVQNAELWDPATGSWSTMAAMSVRRLYHSTAVLLPDGRVLVTGGGGDGPAGDIDHYDAEYYSPPYLFKGNRPTIGSAPESAAYGETFTVATPQAADIVNVTLLALSSTTHEFNQSQRFVPLAFSATADGTGLGVTVPASANIAPPGYYMLFILNGAGVPSIAKMVRIAAAASASSGVSATTLPEVAASAVTLAWATHEPANSHSREPALYFPAFKVGR